MREFSHPMEKREAIFGWIYLIFHAVIFPLAVDFGIFCDVTPFGITLDDITQNVIIYAFGFVMVLVFMNGYLRRSFSDMCDNLLRTVSSVCTGYCLYYISIIAINLLLSVFLDNIDNPNTETINALSGQDYNRMLAIAALFAPIIEECLFRGVVFGTLRKRNRIIALIASALAFSFYHLWQYFVFCYEPSLFLYLLQYIPVSIILAFTYERSNTIWAPIFLHALINALATV